MEHGNHHSGHNGGQSRRSFLAASGVALGSTVLVAGCLGNGEDDGASEVTAAAGGAELRQEAVSWDELGDLSGELTIYSDRKRGQIDPLFETLEATYDDLEIVREYGDNMLGQLKVERSSTPADIYYTQSSGELAALKSEGLAAKLPGDIVEAIDENYSDPDGHWTGASGRVRAVLYNSDVFSADELPDDIFEYAEDERFAGRISTRPNSGTFRSFIVAMIELEGEKRTREWVRKMVNDQDITLYSGGSQQAEAVHNGEQDIALGNQYYAGRIIGTNPDSPLSVTFTNDDPGCLFNVSGLAITAGVDDEALAADFIRHTLGAEGQEFFVETNGEYPVVDEVPYVGELPTADEINPPSFDLNALEDVDHAQDLLREEGMTV